MYLGFPNARKNGKKTSIKTTTTFIGLLKCEYMVIVHGTRLYTTPISRRHYLKDTCGTRRN